MYNMLHKLTIYMFIIHVCSRASVTFFAKMWLLQVFMCCLLYYIQFLVSADEVIISSDATCLEKPHQLHCQSLENVSKQAVNNTIVKIIDKQHILHGRGVTRIDRAGGQDQQMRARNAPAKSKSN